MSNNALNSALRERIITYVASKNSSWAEDMSSRDIREYMEDAIINGVKGYRDYTDIELIASLEEIHEYRDCCGSRTKDDCCELLELAEVELEMHKMLLSGENND